MAFEQMAADMAPGVAKRDELRRVRRQEQAPVPRAAPLGGTPATPTPAVSTMAPPAVLQPAGSYLQYDPALAGLLDGGMPAPPGQDIVTYGGGTEAGDPGTYPGLSRRGVGGVGPTYGGPPAPLAPADTAEFATDPGVAGALDYRGPAPEGYDNWDPEKGAWVNDRGLTEREQSIVDSVSGVIAGADPTGLGGGIVSSRKEWPGWLTEEGATRWGYGDHKVGEWGDIDETIESSASFPGSKDALMDMYGALKAGGPLATQAKEFIKSGTLAPLTPVPQDDEGWGGVPDDIIKDYFDAAGAKGDFDALRDLSNEERDAALRNMYEGMAGRGMAQSGAAGGAAYDIHRGAARDLAVEFENMRQNKVREMHDAASLLFEDKWRGLDRAHQLKIAEWMFDHQVEMAEILNELQQGNPGPLKALWEDFKSLF